MKTILFLAASLFSLSSFAIDSNYDKSCARRYINASQNLVDIAQRFNNADMSAAEYAVRVSSVDSSVLAMRAYCINENRAAEKCVSHTKDGYSSIRKKMEVRSVIKGTVERVSVSELDLTRLVKGNVSGFFNGLANGEENICVL